MRTDIKLTELNDLEFTEAGDLSIGTSDSQHIQHILQAQPGDFKESPLTGASTIQMLNGSVSGVEKRRMKSALEADGYRVNSIKQKNGGIEIDAE